MYKKCAAQLDLIIYFCRFRCRRRLALHDFIFVGVNYKYINESFAFSPGLISILYPQMWVLGVKAISTPTRLLLPHVDFSVLVFGTKPSETSHPICFCSQAFLGHVYFIRRLRQQHHRYSRFFP